MVWMARLAAMALPAEKAIVSRRARWSEHAPQAITRARAAAFSRRSFRNDSTRASIFHVEHVTAGAGFHGHCLRGLRRFLPSQQEPIGVIGGDVVLERRLEPRAGRGGLDET